MKYKSIILSLLFILLNTFNTYSSNEKTFKIGVLSFENKEDTLNKWLPLSAYLSESLVYSFEIVPLFYEEMNEVVCSGKVDFIFTNPGHYVKLKNICEVSGTIATLIEKDKDEIQYDFGGVIFTRSDNDKINKIEDLRNKKISAVSKSSLGGYQASAYELYKEGINLNRISFKFTGMPHKNAVHLVLNGVTDAGFVRTGVLEKMILDGEIQAKDIKIINKKTHSNFNKAISTELYPEWPFAATLNVDSEIARLVASALLRLSENKGYTEKIGIYGFNIPSNYLVVEEMMRSLKLAPFDKEREVTFLEIWKNYRIYILTLSLVICLLLFSMIIKFMSEREIKRKNKILNEVMEKLEMANNELNKTSLTDSLTKVYNRRAFDIFLTDKLNLAKRSELNLGLLVIDVDHFKQVNDTYGHLAGDEILKSVALTIANQILRKTDGVFRFGGDEFAVIIYDTSYDGMIKVANKIHKGVSELAVSCTMSKEELCVKLSIGGYVLQVKNNTKEEDILSRADKALYSAKENGRNQVVIHKD